MLANNETNLYPFWYFINDPLIIIINIIGILVSILFIYIVIRLKYPSYSISDLIACKTCLAIGLMSSTILFNNCYALASDFRGVGYIDSYCHFRGLLFSVFFVKMYTSLCLKAFNRLRCIVYHIRSVARSFKYLLILILTQWTFVVFLTLPIILTDAIHYDWGSHLCLVSIEKSWQFSYLMIIYYVSMTFISSVYLYILYYVMNLSLLEAYRRKRQLAVFRRILILIVMLMLPGICYFLCIIYWNTFDSLPSYSFKIITLIESIGHTGAILTIFLSNTRVRRYFYRRREILKQKKKDKLLKHIPKENFDLILIQRLSILE